MSKERRSELERNLEGVLEPFRRVAKGAVGGVLLQEACLMSLELLGEW